MDVFAITPASAKPMWLIGVVCVLISAVVLALAYTAYASRHSRVEIDDGRLRLVGDFWGRAIPFAELDLADARVVDLDAEPGQRPRRRTLGTGLPGYASGWFRLRGGEKALVYLTGARRVARVPTTQGYVLLLSVDDPERFLSTLKARAGQA